MPPPTAGKPHPDVSYKDLSGYWGKIRYLACTLLTPPGGSAEDAFALFGNLNLAQRRSGSASEVAVNPDFVRWLLETIRDKLRPSFLVCLGLKGMLREDPDLRKVFETTLGLNLRGPHAYDKGFLKEWSVADGQPKIVFWPNHPSQRPFRSFEKWETACEEFKNRNSKLVDRIGAA